MLYKNIKTGAVIDVKSTVSGRCWQEVKPAGRPSKSPAKGSEEKGGKK